MLFPEAPAHEPSSGNPTSHQICKGRNSPFNKPCNSEYAKCWGSKERTGKSLALQNLRALLQLPLDRLPAQHGTDCPAAQSDRTALELMQM